MSQPIRGHVGHFGFLSARKTILVEDIEILLPVNFVEFRKMVIARVDVKNASANQRPEWQSCFSDRPEKHKLGRGQCVFATCECFFEIHSLFSHKKSKMW